MKFYDKKNKRLVMSGKEATSEYWDKNWQTEDFIKKVKCGKHNLLLKNITKKFLDPDSRILEGGCGIGRNVYALKDWGYDVYGVDFAEKTIRKIKKEFPELKVSTQDLRSLDFSDNFFDGYWSFGVIEHFWQGYGEILQEAKRVIKAGGYLFLIFPYMSSLRRLKAKLRLYKNYEINLVKEDNFYQFILNTEKVKTDVKEYGFELVLKRPLGATKGIKDEIFWLKPILQKIYDSQNIVVKGMNIPISFLFSGIAGHTILLVFKKL
jgi:SAM-dependent methyltransferase